MTGPQPGPRTFDPAAVARHEAKAWVAYYRRDWRRLLVAAVGMVRAGFGMDPVRTVYGAWLVGRATRAWSPYPDNDPDAALAFMRRFYALVVRHTGALRIDPDEAARLEITWWRRHRERQYGVLTEDGPLVESLVDLYTLVYDVPRASVREAARRRVDAMALSDRWVAAGCSLDDPLLDQEREALLASYTSLRAAV